MVYIHHNINALCFIGDQILALHLFEKSSGKQSKIKRIDHKEKREITEEGFEIERGKKGLNVFLSLLLTIFFMVVLPFSGPASDGEYLSIKKELFPSENQFH